VQIELETKKHFYQNFQDFEGLKENFEFRQRICAFVSSVNVIVYPKFMVVNKNAMDILCMSTEQKEWQIMKSYSNYYFNNQGKKN
jgi:hypothetical protein